MTPAHDMRVVVGGAQDFAAVSTVPVPRVMEIRNMH